MKKRFAHNQSKRGFSILEMVLALAVSMVLVSSIATLTIFLVRHADRNFENGLKSVEIDSTKNMLYSFYDRYCGYTQGEDEYIFSTQDQDYSLVVSRAGEEVSRLTFDPLLRRLIKDGVGVFTFQRIDEIRFFVYGANVVKTLIRFGSNDVLIVILLTPMEHTNV